MALRPTKPDLTRIVVGAGLLGLVIWACIIRSFFVWVGL